MNYILKNGNTYWDNNKTNLLFPSFTPKHCLFGAKFNDFSAFLALNVGSSRCLRHDSLSKKVSPSVALLTFTNLCMTNIVQYVWCISVWHKVYFLYSVVIAWITVVCWKYYFHFYLLHFENIFIYLFMHSVFICRLHWKNIDLDK